MPSAIVRFRPTGPWRFGPDSGSRDRVDLVYHSDSLYAAVTQAMLRLDHLDAWLNATARKTDGEPEVRFSSLFPFQREHLFVPPPRSMWPPPPSTKIRYKSARFIPLSIVQSLIAEKAIDENRWIIDGECQCMIPSGDGPFRIALRNAAGVDRVNAAAVEPHTTACIEFGRDAGLWTLVVFSSDAARSRWQPRVASAFRLLADTGFGGERSLGWGRSEDPKWNRAPDLAFEIGNEPTGFWLLSLYAPAPSDTVDWQTGNYTTVTRTGRTESASNWGAAKSPTLMIAEGSVIVAGDVPRGEARDVAPADFAHPVYRSGFAVTIPIPWRAPGTQRPKPQPPPEAVTLSEPAAPAAEEPAPAPPQPEPEAPHAPEPAPEEPHVPSPEPEEPHVPEPEPEEPAPAPQPEPEAPASDVEEPTPAPSEPKAEEPHVPEPEPEEPTPAPRPEPEAPASDVEEPGPEPKQPTEPDEPVPA